MATITITENSIVLATVECKKGGNLEISNALFARRLANRLYKNDNDFPNTTDDPDFSIEDAAKMLELFVSAYARIEDYDVTVVSDTTSTWRLQQRFEAFAYDMRMRGISITRGNRSRYWIVRLKRCSWITIASFHNGVYYSVTLDTLKNLNSDYYFDSHTPTFCPYTGETDPQKLHWMGVFDRFAYGNCWVATKWVNTREALTVCPDCGEVVRKSTMREVYDYATNQTERVCPNCAYNATFCRFHNRYEIGTDFRNVNGRFICDSGYETAVADNQITTCPHCHHEIFVEDLRTLIDEDDEEVQCCTGCSWQINRGFDWKNQSRMLSYETKPNPRFYDVDGKHKVAEKDLYIGFELELDQEHRNWRQKSNEDSHEFAVTVMKEWNGEFYVKRDGSLDYGAETVSMPHTIEAIYNVNWGKYFNLVEEYNLADNPTCGLHTHISTTAFGGKDVNIAKLIVLINRNYEWFTKVARREYSNISHWAAKYDSYCVPTEMDCFSAVGILRRCKGDGRYHAVNLRNEATVELRLWASTTDEDVLTATCDFAQALVRMACAISVEEAYTFTPKDIMEKCLSYAYDAGNVKALFDNTVGE